MLAKGVAARFADKGKDSGEVVGLVERLREAISHYQVSENRCIALGLAYKEEQISQQQTIYDRITKIAVSAP